MSRRTLWILGLAIALLIAGIGSFYASSHPDGLEYVASKAGFGDAADDSPTADGPLADYQTKGIDDPRLSGGVAGVLGALVVLGLAGGLFWLVGRGRRPAPPSSGSVPVGRSRDET